MPDLSFPSFAWLVAAFIGGMAATSAKRIVSDTIADRWQHWRAARKSQAQFREVAASMPKLMAEIREDLARPGHERERTAWLLPKGAQFGMLTPGFRYHFEEHEDLSGKFQVLEENGYVKRLPHHQAEKFRFHKHFVDLLLAHDS